MRAALCYAWIAREPESAVVRHPCEAQVCSVRDAVSQETSCSRRGARLAIVVALGQSAPIAACIAGRLGQQLAPSHCALATSGSRGDFAQAQSFRKIQEITLQH